MNTSYPTHNVRMRQLLQLIVSQWLTRRIGRGKSLKFSFFKLSLIFFLPLLIASFLCSSCEKEAVLTPMAAFYEESAGLPQESLDSIQSFTAKFGNYVVCRPESRQDQYYQPTLDNSGRRQKSSGRRARNEKM